MEFRIKQMEKKIEQLELELEQHKEITKEVITALDILQNMVEQDSANVKRLLIMLENKYSDKDNVIYGRDKLSAL